MTRDGRTLAARTGRAGAAFEAGRVLLVEDDPALCSVVELTLVAAGMEVTVATDGETAWKTARSEGFAVVLLDLMLPALDGLEVCRRIRETSDVPIIMVTALDSTGDVVAGLEAGADDYVTKPFEGPELLARIRALLRRAQPPSDSVHHVGDLAIDAAAHRVHKRGREVHLSAMEFRLLLVLSENAGNVLTRDVLLDRVWGYDYVGDSRLVDMAVKRLRAKIEDDPSNPTRVVTVRGVGYRLEPG